MKLPNTLASVRVNETYIPLSQGITTVQGLKFELVLENKTENLYSWVVYVENTTDAPSPRITDFMGMDLTLPLNGSARLNTLRGDDCTIHSFYPETFPMEDGSAITRAPIGGRSSNTTAFPYFDVEDASGEGIVWGIGWSGQWQLDAIRNGNCLHLKAGFQECDLYLRSQETLRSIRILLYFGKGNEDQLRQQFVRLHRRYYSPIPTINPHTYFPIASSSFDRYFYGFSPIEGKINYFETEQAQVHIIENSAKCSGMNTYWLDACWFDGAFRNGVGNYRYGDGFPNGLRGLSDLAHSKGLKFILWFEPGRAFVGTDLYALYGDDPQKIITLPENKRALVNLGDPEMWQYQFDHIAKIIEDNRVDVYRQDFNIDPYPYLKTIEDPERIGMTQIRFVEGMYRLWDALQARFPGLLIDNCASGGRMLDVESAMRAIPLWRSDMGCRPSPSGMQNETLLLSRYLPYHQGGAFEATPYFLRSVFTTGVSGNFAMLADHIAPEREAVSISKKLKPEALVTEVKLPGRFDPATISAALQDVIRLREYWNGDFTALTPPSDNRKELVGYTLRLPLEDRGAVLIFRREEAPKSFIVRLPDINTEKTYLLTLSDEALAETQQIVSGKMLSEGFPVTIDTVPGSLLILYKAQ